MKEVPSLERWKEMQGVRKGRQLESGVLLVVVLNVLLFSCIVGLWGEKAVHLLSCWALDEAYSYVV